MAKGGVSEKPIRLYVMRDNMFVGVDVFEDTRDEFQL